MGVQGRNTFSRIAIIGAALAAVFMLGHLAQPAALAEEAAAMSLSVSGCSGDECDLDLGESFTLTVNVDAAPAEGYVLVQSFIDYGPDLTYNMTDTAGEEVTWPDVIPDVVVRDSIAPNTVLHGGLTGVIPPLPLSTYEGSVFELAMECSDTFSSNNVQLLPEGDPVAGTSGALLTGDNGEQIFPKVASVTVNCGEAPPEPTATPDGDGDGDGDGDIVLPPSGSGPLSTGDNGSNAMLWLVIGGLFAIGAAGLGASGWRAARSR